MRKLFTALATATILLLAGFLVSKVEAAPLSGVGDLPLTKNYSPLEAVAC
jgi:hypothetical protein